MKRYLLFLLTLSGALPLAAQLEPPSVYSNLFFRNDSLFFEQKGRRLPEQNLPAPYRLDNFRNAALSGTTGLVFDFKNDSLAGTLYYGFIPYGDSRHPKPVFFRNASPIVAGKTSVDIKNRMAGRYDMIDWKGTGQGTLGYRVVSNLGDMLYDGVVSFRAGNEAFEVAPTIVEGPFVTLVQPEEVTIRFELSQPTNCDVTVAGKKYRGRSNQVLQEIRIDKLEPATTYEYTVNYSDFSQTYSFTTAPAPGSRSEFSFAYASDSRSGQGGGERNIEGTNAYIMQRIMALAVQQEAAFMQFSGDLVNGYVTDPGYMNLQYANWKRAIQPWAHYLPVYVSMGNHEALMRVFTDDRVTLLIDRFPFETESGEAVFNQNFTQPLNGPESEDGGPYDPDPDQIDFPSYKENVFYYTYDNVAMIVLNSDYLYAPLADVVGVVGGNIHAYLMDQQMAWLAQTLDELENDPDIDHVFVTQHTPAFPNGGHVADDMWYLGNNAYRPFINGVRAEKGIIERRDEYLDLLINQSTKVRAILTGDEHNYARTEVGPGMNMYPGGWAAETLTLSRTIWQVNNGAAGAPYYAQEQTPWTPRVQGFTTQNALVFFHVSGAEVEVQVLNPDTLEEVDRFQLTGDD